MYMHTHCCHQLVRVLANMSVESWVGSEVASHKDIVEGLLSILGKNTHTHQHTHTLSLSLSQKASHWLVTVS